MPFIVAFAAYSLGLVAHYFPGSLDDVYQITILAGEVAFGTQLAYTGYKGVKAATEKIDARNVTGGDVTTDKAPARSTVTMGQTPRRRNAGRSYQNGADT
jgi:hypothetical protein